MNNLVLIGGDKSLKIKTYSIISITSKSGKSSGERVIFNIEHTSEFTDELFHTKGKIQLKIENKIYDFTPGSTTKKSIYSGEIKPVNEIQIMDTEISMIDLISARIYLTLGSLIGVL